MTTVLRSIVAFLMIPMLFGVLPAAAQIAPSAEEAAGYTGLHAAAHAGDAEALRNLIRAGADLAQTDSHGRTPLHVAVFGSHADAVRTLAEAGADMNALENDAYDAVTIAAVADDVEMLKLVLALGCRPGNITSPYEGTALIAAAHLGHDEVVQVLIDAGAPLDHVNNLEWTALIESIVLGDGGPRHVNTARALIHAGADISIADGQGNTPYELARARGYRDMMALFPAR